MFLPGSRRFPKNTFLPGSRALECRLAFGLIRLKPRTTRTMRIKAHCGVFIAVGFSQRSAVTQPCVGL